MMHCLLCDKKEIIWAETECKPGELKNSESYKQYFQVTFISKPSSCLLCSSITLLLFLLVLRNIWKRFNKLSLQKVESWEKLQL